jgi:hypothetical protein
MVEASPRMRLTPNKRLELVELPDGRVVGAELHWYEAHGIGRVDMKIKRPLEW